MSRPTSKKWGHSTLLPKRRGGHAFIKIDNYIYFFNRPYEFESYTYTNLFSLIKIFAFIRGVREAAPYNVNFYIYLYYITQIKVLTCSADAAVILRQTYMQKLPRNHRGSFLTAYVII